MRRIFGAIFLGTAALLSCQVILGLDAPSGTEPPSAGDGGPVDLCEHRIVPGKPDASDGPDIHPILGQWFAARSYDVPYQDDAGLGPGLDLDGRCTCNPDPKKRDLFDGGPSCTPLISLNDETCDKSGGADDAFGTSLGNFFAAVSALDPRADGNRDIQTGLRSAMVWVGRWNGQPDDPSVSVALIPSTGLITAAGCPDGGPRTMRDGGVVGGQVYYPPLFDGCDPWSLRKDDIVGGGDAGPPTPTAVVEAYVTNNVLVANLARSPISLLGADLLANDGHLVARITSVNGGGYALDGFLAGRVPFDGLVSAVSDVRVTTGGVTTPLCQQPQFLKSFVDRVCGDLDLMALPTQDNTGKTCDAVSVVFGIHARSSIVANDPFSVDAGLTVPCTSPPPTCF